MTKAKKILITTESCETYHVRRMAEFAFRGYCERCATETELLTLDEAVTVSACKTRELLRRIDTNEIHAIETASGHLLVCQNSLRNFYP